MMGYAKTISRRMGSWEIVQCYQIRGKKLVFEEWAIKGWEDWKGEYTFYDTWEKVRKHMEAK